MIRLSVSQETPEVCDPRLLYIGSVVGHNASACQPISGLSSLSQMSYGGDVNARDVVLTGDHVTGNMLFVSEAHAINSHDVAYLRDEYST
jgi:hypothetical protein